MLCLIGEYEVVATRTCRHPRSAQDPRCRRYQPTSVPAKTVDISHGGAGEFTGEPHDEATGVVDTHAKASDALSGAPEGISRAMA
jgi:hypothetical protein